MTHRLPWSNLMSASWLAVVSVLCGAQETQKHMAPVVETRAAPTEVPVPPNMAHYAQVTASSEFLPRFPAWRAVDGTGIIVTGGVRENCWASAPGMPSKGQWFQLSFGRPEPIGKVLVWYRVIQGEHRFVPKTVTIQASEDGKTWHTVVSRSANVPRSNAPPDRAPREYACQTQAAAVRLLFEDGAQPDDRFDVVEVVEVMLPPPPDWVPPTANTGSTVDVRGSKTLPLVLPGEQPLDVREDVRDGRTRLVYGADGEEPLEEFQKKKEHSPI